MTEKVLWTKFGMEVKDGVDSYVPGVTVPGNRRPRKPMKVNTGRKTQEIKAKIPVQQPVMVENLTPRKMDTKPDTKMDTFDDLTQSLEETPAKNKRHSRKTSLKDLCADDKKRVANLIKELAKMGDEKEKAMDQLQSERRQFEKQVLQLVDQQEQILSEREDIQSRLFQCQNLLGRYKDQILDKEEKLNEDVKRLSPSRRKSEASDRLHNRRSRSPVGLSPNDQGKKTVPRDRKTPSPDAAHRDERHARSPKSDFMDVNKENLHGKNEVLHKRYADMENARSNIRRPYTSLIDKEIAHEKQYPDGPSTIASETLTPRSCKSIGYYNRIPTLGMFRNPIMSSTQKSADINAFMAPQSPTDEFHPLEPDHSPRSSRASLQELVPVDRQKCDQNVKSNSKVGFKEKLEVNDDELEKHSPSVRGSVGDKKFLEEYKRLKPSERKRELLKQREALLEEQQKLKQILLEQESKLMQKREQLERKQNNHKSRLDYLEQNGQFPARAEMDSVQGDDESVFNGKVDKLNLDKQLSDEEDDIPYEAAEMGMRERVEQLKDYSTKGTSPIHHPHPPYHSMATSPIRVEHSSDNSPARIDVGTSISRVMFPHLDEEHHHRHNPSADAVNTLPYKNPRSPKSPRLAEKCEAFRQSNLPLQANRQKSVSSPAHHSQHTPGEKTLSVVEIVNSMDESPSWNGSHRNYSPARPADSQQKTSLPARVAGTAQILSPGGGKIGVMPLSPAVRDRFDENEAEETAEESEILDDIFFLK